MKPILDACCGSKMFWFNHHFSLRDPDFRVKKLKRSESASEPL